MNAVSIKNLSFRYKENRQALSDVSFELSEGSTTALLGPNGAGKSTLLLCLCGLILGDGEIALFGEPLTMKTAKHLRRKIGFVFQNPDDQILMPKVVDDVAYGLLNQGKSSKEAQEQALEALISVGMEHEAYSSPHELSYGEKKRVALAGALVMKPDLLLMDEPSANLDPKSRRDLMRLISALPQTKIIATHDLELALELCPRTILIDKGKLVAEGDTQTMMADEALMSEHSLETPAVLRLKSIPFS